MTLIFDGIIKGVDEYNKLIINVINPELITKKINDIKNPYKYNNNELECKVIIYKYKDYYIQFINNNIDKLATVKVTIKRYCFNNKKGTSLLLKEIYIKD